MSPQNNTFDIVLVTGTGIDRDGTLPQSAEAKVKKACELYFAGKTKHIIFSGKYSYNLRYKPKKTEAEAMRDFCIRQGVPKEYIYVEDKSYSTVSNICIVKDTYLKPKKWRRVGFVIILPLKKRAEYNLKMVLGKEYEYVLIEADYTYPSQKYDQLVEIEKRKIKECIAFYEDIEPGDSERIKYLSDKEISSALK